jgi:hypothetical protein
MKPTAIAIENHVNELLICLDEDIRHIQKSLLLLNEMRKLVIKRDDIALGKLLQNIQSESDGYQSNELKRQSIRKELAKAFGFTIEQMTLSVLESSLPESKRVQITERKTRLRTLVDEYKKEHIGTAMLLAECARFNNLLLKSIFDFRRTEGVCYDSSGTAERESDTAFVNMQF